MLGIENEVAFYNHLQGYSKKFITLRSMGKNHLACILMILMYNKRIEIVSVIGFFKYWN